MNVICKKNPACERDPFATSDRDFQGGAGKGDRDRSNRSVFKRNFPKDLCRQRLAPGKHIFRYR